ncbi:hypothetical protein N0V88_000719 [Collariella sp. IMI 366227]|nr:hypothetical protein N0V88_000719 [Collariella sp. IMI 366227]
MTRSKRFVQATPFGGLPGQDQLNAVLMQFMRSQIQTQGRWALFDKCVKQEDYPTWRKRIINHFTREGLVHHILEVVPESAEEATKAVWETDRNDIDHYIRKTVPCNRVLASIEDLGWEETERNPKKTFHFVRQHFEAHFGRMERHLGIARLEQSSVTLNSRRLRGFVAVIRELSAHSKLVNEPVTLINPRGVHLLGDSQGKGIEHGDYAYDVSKLLFSLTGLSRIRKGLFDLVADTGRQSYTLTIRQHPGIDTVDGVAYRLFQELAGNDVMRRWIDKVEPDGVRSFELRARLGEAAHFVADCVCALGRNVPQEVVPLFLTGLKKLNSVLDLMNGTEEL